MNAFEAFEARRPWRAAYFRKLMRRQGHALVAGVLLGLLLSLVLVRLWGWMGWAL